MIQILDTICGTLCYYLIVASSLMGIVLLGIYLADYIKQYKNFKKQDTKFNDYITAIWEKRRNVNL